MTENLKCKSIHGSFKEHYNVEVIDGKNTCLLCGEVLLY